MKEENRIEFATVEEAEAGNDLEECRVGFLLHAECKARLGKRAIDPLCRTMHDHQTGTVPDEQAVHDPDREVRGIPASITSHENTHTGILSRNAQ